MKITNIIDFSTENICRIIS